MYEEKFYDILDAIERHENVELDCIFYEDFCGTSPTPDWIKVKTGTGFNCYPTVNASLQTKLADLHNNALRHSRKCKQESVKYLLALPGYKITKGEHLEHSKKVDEVFKVADERLKVSRAIFTLAESGFTPKLIRARLSANRFMSYLPSECESVNDIEGFFRAGKATGANGVKKIVFNVPNLSEQIFYFNQRSIAKNKAIAQITRNFTRFEVNLGKVMANVYQPV